jgi:glyoxylase-like metal-dependent hydrolase (beta-lactamase superfamily II)
MSVASSADAPDGLALREACEAAGLTVFERGWLSSNCVLFDAGPQHETVLVDSGYWIHATQTVELVRRALNGRVLDRVVNTHLHSDHCGGNAELVAQFGCTIDVPHGETSVVDNWDASALSFDATGQHCPLFRRDGSLAAGTTTRLGRTDWLALPAPGHDPHSLALYQPEQQILISADALWENGFGVVFPEIDGVNAFRDVRSTLELFATLPIRWVIPGHGAPFCGAASAIERALSRLVSFEAEPARHARHAARVLVKFRLLEVRSATLVDLVAWMTSTPLLSALHRNFGSAVSMVDWCMSVVNGLVGSDALRRDGDKVYDR